MCWQSFSRKMNDRKRCSYFHPGTLSGFIHLILHPVESTIGIGLFALFLFSIYTFCTLFPGVIYTNAAAVDNYVFIDGIHRIWSGHTPHLDFSTALGALNFLWPAVFGLITDSEFKAFLFYQISFLAIILAIQVYISRTRMNYFCAIILLIYLAALVGTPVPMGSRGSLVTFAGYYNRFGWALLIVSFLMTVSSNRLREESWCFEAFLAAVILWIAFYTKITYFIAILGIFIISAFFDRRWLKTVIASSLCLIIGMVCCELFRPGLHLSYFSDLVMTSKATQGSCLMAWDDFKGNVVSLLASSFSIGIVFLVHREFNILSFPFFLTTACYNVFISIFVASNNTDFYGLPSLLALYVTGLILVSKGVPKIDEAHGLQKFALISLGLLVFWSAIPEAIERQGGLERFFRIGYFNKRYPYPFPFPEPMREMKIMEGEVGFLEKLDANGNVTLTIEDLRTHAIPPRQEIYQTQYAYMVAKGYQALQEVFSQWGSGPIIHLGFSNPFSTLLAVPSARGDYAWYHAGRNFSERVHRCPEMVFQDAKFVMFSRFPSVAETTKQLNSIYGDYIKRNYTLIHNDAYWQIYLSDKADRTGEQTRCSDIQGKKSQSLGVANRRGRPP